MFEKPEQFSEKIMSETIIKIDRTCCGKWVAESTKLGKTEKFV